MSADDSLAQVQQCLPADDEWHSAWKNVPEFKVDFGYLPPTGRTALELCPWANTDDVGMACRAATWLFEAEEFVAATRAAMEEYLLCFPRAHDEKRRSLRELMSAGRLPD